MDYAVIVKGLNREGVHLHMRIRPRLANAA